MTLAGPDNDFHFEHGEELPEGCWIFSDLVDVFNEFGGTEFQQDNLIAEVLNALDSAVEGVLEFSTDRRDKKAASDVWRNGIRLLEIRLPVPIRLKSVKYVGRLYAFEPIATLYDGIVVLLFHVKKDGNREDLKRQDAYIDRAFERLPATTKRLATP